METTEDMIKYIFQVVNTIEINSLILKKFLEENNIGYSLNKNGIFINISLLSEEMVFKFYKLISDNYNESIENDKYEEEYGLYLANINNDHTNKQKQTDINTISYQNLNLSEIQVKVLNLI